MIRDSRQELISEAGVRVQAMTDPELDRWRELWEDAATDFQRACLEAALAAEHPLAEVHAFADAIRGQDDGALAIAVRPPAGDSNQDPLRAFQINGNVLTPRSKKSNDPPPYRLVDLTGGAGPKHHGNVLDVVDLGGSAGGRSLHTTAQTVPGETAFRAAAAPFGIQFIGHSLDTGGKFLAQALKEVETALARGCPVPALLGGAKGSFERYVIFLQVAGDAARKAFQIHDPFANETVWVNHRDLESARELPFEDKTLRRVTGVLLPVGR